MADPRPAPDWRVSQWLNTQAPLSLDALRGKVVMLEAFQMLCPGCVSHGLPQASRVFELFDTADVAVIGLHTVFEHHDAMGPEALRVFLQEYRIRFPVGVDTPSDTRGLPLTMAAYGFQGTPSIALIDRLGRRRAQHFGAIPDLRLGAEIMALVKEQPGVGSGVVPDVGEDGPSCPAPGA
ncbi:MAG: TlpA family protein disulfide reductase [Maricaulaceae bacterium]